jgi:hypothetical protein
VPLALYRPAGGVLLGGGTSLPAAGVGSIVTIGAGVGVTVGAGGASGVAVCSGVAEGLADGCGCGSAGWTPESTGPGGAGWAAGGV